MIKKIFFLRYLMILFDAKQKNGTKYSQMLCITIQHSLLHDQCDLIFHYWGQACGSSVNIVGLFGHQCAKKTFHFLLCPNILKILFKLLMFKTLFKDQDLFQLRQDILCGNVYSWLTHMASVDLADAENIDGAAQHIWFLCLEDPYTKWVRAVQAGGGLTVCALQ